MRTERSVCHGGLTSSARWVSPIWENRKDASHCSGSAHSAVARDATGPAPGAARRQPAESFSVPSSRLGLYIPEALLRCQRNRLWWHALSLRRAWPSGEAVRWQRATPFPKRQGVPPEPALAAPVGSKATQPRPPRDRVTSIGASPRHPTYANSVTRRSVLRTASACIWTNFGGKALPIINAVANFPSSSRNL